MAVAPAFMGEIMASPVVGHMGVSSAGVAGGQTSCGIKAACASSRPVRRWRCVRPAVRRRAPPGVGRLRRRRRRWASTSQAWPGYVATCPQAMVGDLVGRVAPLAFWGFGPQWVADPPQCGCSPILRSMRHRPRLVGIGAGGIVYRGGGGVSRRAGANDREISPAGERSPETAARRSPPP